MMHLRVGRFVLDTHRMLLFHDRHPDFRDGGKIVESPKCKPTRNNSLSYRRARFKDAISSWSVSFSSVVRMCGAKIVTDTTILKPTRRFESCVARREFQDELKSLENSGVESKIAYWWVPTHANWIACWQVRPYVTNVAFYGFLTNAQFTNPKSEIMFTRLQYPRIKIILLFLDDAKLGEVEGNITDLHDRLRTRKMFIY